jgi:hypothetical protein
MNKISKNILVIFLGLVISYFLVTLLKFHYSIILFPYQLEYREGASLLLANELLQGNFPYTLKNQPNLSDVFGCLYSIFSIPFLKVFGVHLSSMLILSGISIVLVSVFFYIKQKSNRHNYLITITLTVLFYALNLFTVIPINRPDSLGFLLFTLSMYLPVNAKFSRNSLILALFFCLLAYLTKSYFILGFPFLLFYIFLFHSKLRAIKYGTLFFLSFILLQVILHSIFDFYFIGTFSNQLASTVNNFNHLFNQINFYFFKFLLIPTTILFFYLLRKIIVKRQLIFQFVENPNKIISILNLNSFKSPLLNRSTDFDINWLYFSLGLIIILFKLGGHTGQFGVYLIHFLSFPFLLLVSNILHQYKQDRYGVLKLFLVVLMVSKALTILSVNRNFEVTKEFKAIVHTIKKSKKVLATPILASVLVEQHKYVYASGLTEYFFYVPALKNNYGLPTIIAKVKDKLLLPTIMQSEFQIRSYLEDIQKNVVAKKFDVIYLDNTIYDDWMVDPKLVKKYYRIVDTTNVVMYASFQENKIFKLVPRN